MKAQYRSLISYFVHELIINDRLLIVCRVRGRVIILTVRHALSSRWLSSP